MFRTATLFAIAASVSLSSQAPPSQTGSASVTGCVAEVQRDGSLGAKASGVQATPETAAIEANNPNPTGRYQLLDATLLASDKPQTETATAGSTAKPDRTTYALRGHERELASHTGHRVQITGTLAPALEAKLPAKEAKAADGIRTLQVVAVKMIGTDCSAKGK